MLQILVTSGYGILISGLTLVHLLVHQALKVFRVLLVLRVFKELRAAVVFKVLQDLQALKDLLELVSKDLQDLRVQDHKVLQDLQDLLAPKVFRVLLVLV